MVTPTPKKPKNKPKFFSTLLTLIFVAAGVFGVYKVVHLMESNPVPAFVDKTETATQKADTTDKAEQTTEATGSDEAAALVKAIGEADDTLSAELLAYCADNIDVKGLQTVLEAITGDDYDPEVWYTATGKSIHALNALAAGVKETESADKDNITIGFVGRIDPAKAEDGSVDAELSKLMNGMDLQVANNEVAVADEKTVENYKAMGVDLVTLAGSHIFDAGADGLTGTVEALDKQGIAHMGAGKNAEEAAKPAVYVINGRKIAFLSAYDVLYWKSSKAATATSAGVFSIHDGNVAVMNAVKDAKANSDYVFVYLNAGMDETGDWFDGDQDKLTKAVIDAGADGVIGANCSRLQGMQFYKKKLIVYGLGNFLYGEKSADTGLLQVTISKDGTVQNVFHPCRLNDGKVALCGADTKAGVFERVQKYCGNVVKFGTDGTVMGNRG